MKIRVLLLASLSINLALFGAFWAARQHPDTGSSPAPAGDHTSGTTSAARATKVSQGPRTILVEGQSLDWAHVESEDFRQYIANMRAVHVPESTVQDIVIAEVNRIYASKIRALYPAPSTFEFWKAPDRRGGRGGRGGPGGPGANLVPTSRELEQQVRELEAEKRDVIKELLGIDMEMALDRWEGRPSNEDYRLGFLTPEKRDQITELQDRYQAEQRTVWGNQDLSNEERREQFLALRQAEENELRSLLTPQEFEDYQLRTSRTADRMRTSLGTFEPTEQEFRDIFRLRSQYEDQFFGPDIDEQTRQTATASLEQSLANALGSDRYEAYQLAQDDRYRNIADFAQRNELPQETARAIYDIQTVVEEERQQILNDPTLAAQDRDLILAAMVQETQQMLATTLGDALYESYANRDGRWIARIGSADEGRRGGGGRGDRFGRGGGFGGTGGR